MAEIPISLTCADYARVMPLATGEVKPEGIALTMILGSRGSWPARAEMLRRAVQDPEVQGGEWSMAQYLYRVDKGDHRYVGLPVFPLRNFTARDLYVRRGGPIRQPADLAGRVVTLGDAPGGLGKGRVLRHVIDALAVEEHGAPVTQARDVVSPSAHGQAACYFIRPWTWRWRPARTPRRSARPERHSRRSHRSPSRRQ